MKIDEIIDPADTRPVLARYLARFAGGPCPPPDGAAAAAWPTC